MDIPNIIEKSLCNNCSNKIVRVISTEGLPYIDEMSGEIAQAYVTADDAVDFVQYSCVMLCIDLDHIVLDCSKFDEEKCKHNLDKLIRSKAILGKLGGK